MDNNSPQKALLVVFLVALVCSILVSVAAVTLKPIQERNELIERSRNIVALTGLVDPGSDLSGDEILAAVDQLDVRVVDLASGEFTTEFDPAEFDSRAAATDPELGVAIPAEQDLAALGRRSRYEVVYLVWDDDELLRVILPFVGQGMWSTIRGYLALENDLNTIGAVSIYEQTETAGLGDRIQDPDWQALWQGVRLFDNGGDFRFRTGPGIIDRESAAATYQVDSISGATVTSDAMTRMIAYWFGPDGYSPLLDRLQAEPPVRSAPEGDSAT